MRDVTCNKGVLRQGRLSLLLLAGGCKNIVLYYKVLNFIANGSAGLQIHLKTVQFPVLIVHFQVRVKLGMLEKLPVRTLFCFIREMQIQHIATLGREQSSHAVVTGLAV